MKTFHARLPITGTSVTVTLPVNVYYTTPPIVQLTIEGAITHVDIVRNLNDLGDLGFVYTSIEFTFQAGAVGKYFNVTVSPE